MAIDKNSLRSLRVIDIGQGGDVIAPELKKITPEMLKNDRGLDIDRLFEDYVFVDRTIGYAIVKQSNLDKVIGITPAGMPRDDASTYVNWAANVVPPRVRVRLAPPAPAPWYVAYQGAWPRLRGKNSHVAVFDSGVLHGLLRLPRKQNHSDFCACEAPNVSTNDSSSVLHGTLCAGAIGAQDNGGNRTSPAPEATIIAARIYRYEPTLYISLVDILLMLSWVVANDCVPAIVNMSFVLDNDEVERHSKDVLDKILKRLRDGNLALIFASTELHDARALSYPGKLHAVVAIGAYEGLLDDKGNFYIELPLGCDRDAWRNKSDLFFGPANGVLTCDDRQSTTASYGEVSAACAFAAGVAALYLEQRRTNHGNANLLNEVVVEMKQHALRLPDPKIRHDWLAVGTDPSALPRHNANVTISVPCDPSL